MMADKKEESERIDESARKRKMAGTRHTGSPKKMIKPFLMLSPY
jgi:hypothetical protein